MHAKTTIFGLDIGTHKVCCAAGQVGPDNKLAFLGCADVPSFGVVNGSIVDREQACLQVRKALERTDEKLGVRPGKLYVAVSGDHIKGINSRGAVSINMLDGEISDDDVERVVDLAKAVSIPEDRERLHAMPQHFSVDDRSGITDPVGMSGDRLEVSVHIVTASVTSAAELLACVKDAGGSIQEMVFGPIAAAEVLLTPEEKQNGAVLIDIGAGTVDVAVFFEDALWHTESMTLGGRNVTADIAYGLRLPMEAAEELKICQGSALISCVEPAEKLALPDLGEFYQRRISRTVLAAIIEPRMEEILRMVKTSIANTPVTDKIEGGVVLTGGGSCIRDTEALAERVFELPARLAVPKLYDEDICHSSPYGIATAIGLVQYGFSQWTLEEEQPRFFGRIARRCEGVINAILNI